MSTNKYRLLLCFYCISMLIFLLLGKRRFVLKLHEFISGGAYLRDKTNTKECMDFYLDDHIYINI